MSAISIAILEEIGLEGLDGITFEALWRRLDKRGCFYNHENFYTMAWAHILKQNFIQFYRLPEPRKNIKIVDRTDVDDIEAEGQSEEFYTQKNAQRINKRGVMGLCTFFTERTEIPKENLLNLSYCEIVETFGNSFILVASQTYRESLLFPAHLEKPMEMSATLYGMLELIGRSRYRGETTNGSSTLMMHIKDHQRVFYLKKKLVRLGLLTQQLYCRHVPSQGLMKTFLLHLPRFFREHKSSFCIGVEKIVEFLKTSPNYLASYDTLKALLDSDNVIITKKLFKSKELVRYVETDIKVPYRYLYPDATEAEYLLKNKQEKTVRVMQLKDPNINISTLWLKDDQEVEEEGCPMAETSQRLFNVPITRQVYWEVEKSGEKGISQTELGKVMHLTRLQCRALIRNLQNLRLVKMYTVDQGRQRLNKYILPKYHTDIRQRIDHADDNSADELVTGDVDEVEHEVMPPNKDSIYHHLLQNVDEKSEEIQAEIQEMDHMQRHTNLKFDFLSRSISLKMLNRIKMIEQMIQKHIIFSDLNHIVSIVVAKERVMGQKERICRKTIEKILTLLRSQGRIRIYKTTLKWNEVVKVLWFTCHKSVDVNHPMLQESIAKAKTQVMVQRLRKESSKTEVNKSEGDFRRPRTTYKGNNIPKFVRLRLLHEFLFYLVHELPFGSMVMGQEEVLNEWRETYPFTNVIIPEKMPPIYSKEYDWRMFIPPLSKYKGYPRGWVNFQDILMRFPLTLMVKMFPNSIEDPIINEYLDHPIKKNYLLNQLPESVRLHLMHVRVYTAYLHDFLKKLCYMGLLQMGSMSTLKLVSMHIYVNKNASVIDTSSTAPAYTHVEDKKYPMTIYHFATLNDVDKYWEELMMVCFATRLGYRKAIEGREVVVEFVHSKPAMVATLTARKPFEAPERDTGEIPGDHMGAGGLDSVFHAHMKSSWKGKIKRKPGPGPVTPKKKTTIVIPKINKKVSSVTRRRTSVISYKAMVRSRRMPKTKYTRTITKKKQATRGRTVFYDDIDKRAISMMKTLRVSWTAEEDNVLLICRIALRYFTENNRKIYVTGHTIRDILHFSLKSLHKTSKACTRRILYMLKDSATKTSIESCLCEVRQSEMISRKYGENFVENLKNYYRDEELMSAMKHHFINLVIILNGMFHRLSSQGGFTSISRIIPNTYEEFWGKFKETNPKKSGLRYSEPLTHDDIVLSTIYLLFHSSMCTAKDKSPYNLQLFEVYKNYSNEILANAMETIRKHQLISCWKSASRATAKKIVPLQSGPFHLSQLYQNQMLTHVPYQIFKEINGLQNHRGNCLELTDGIMGACYIFGELLPLRQIDVNLELPKKLLIFSTNLPMDSPYERINARFHSIMSNMTSVEIGDCFPDQQNPKKKVAFAPDNDIFIFRQFSSERWMKFQSPHSHLFCFLRYAEQGGSFDTIAEASFDEICSFECLFIDENHKDFVEWIDDITQSDFNNLEKSLEAFTEMTDKLDRRDIKDLGRIKCRRMNVDLQEILRDLIEETSEDLSKWLTQFYQTDGDDDNESSIPNTWQIRRDLGQNSNIDDFSEKSKRFDNYLTLREVKLSFMIKPNAPGTMDDSEREVILDKVRQRSFLKNPTKSVDEVLASFEGGLGKTAKRVLDAIIECQEFGTSFGALERRFGECRVGILTKIIQLFLQESIISLMGIVEYSLVYWKYTHPWVIKSFNLTRLQREAEGSSTAQVMYVNTPSTSKNTDEPPAKRARMEKRTASISVRREDDLKAPSKQKEREFIFLRPYPWIRVNGTLNRRVLDKWMGILLIYLSKTPGISMNNLAQHFNYIHPTQIRLLVEILEDLKCVKLFTLKVPKCTLRSTYRSPEIENSHKLAPFDRTMIEILPCAFTHYAAFVSDRKYTMDFI